MTAKHVAGSPAIPELTDADKAAARKEGATEALKESAKESYQYLTDGNLPGDGEGSHLRWPTKSDIMQFAYIIDLPIDEFEERVSGKTMPLAEDKVAGLLELEKSGQNRTPYVEALVKRLGVKSVREVTAAGPNYTNDVSTTTAKHH